MAESESKAVGWAANLGAWLAVVSVCAACAGPAAAHFGLLKPLSGFALMASALPLSLAGLLLLLAALVVSSDPALRFRCLCGSVVAVFTFCAIMFPALGSRGLPRINDITTDTVDPPRFVHAGVLAANRGLDMSYPGGEFAALQRQAYPELAPSVVADSPARVFQRVYGIILDLPGAEITDTDPIEGRIEATATSRVFRFVDDFVARIRPHEAGAIVDLRSRSRDGRGDLGVNAARIEAVLDALH